MYDETNETFGVWAVATNGDSLYRHGVRKTNPAGTLWEHISVNNQPLVSISACKNAGVWAIGRNGKIIKILYSSWLFSCMYLYEKVWPTDAAGSLPKMNVEAIGKQLMTRQKI